MTSYTGFIVSSMKTVVYSLKSLFSGYAMYLEIRKLLFTLGSFAYTSSEVYQNEKLRATENSLIFSSYSEDKMMVTS